MSEGMEGNATLLDLLSSTPSTSAATVQTLSTQTYLPYLTSLSLPEIIAEPSKLSSESSFLTAELTNLCHAQYPTFLSLHSASIALSSSFSSFSTALSNLVEASVPELESRCKEFVKETRDIQVERRKLTTVAEQSEKLLDILEIPQLIDTCVRNGYYQEALDLSAHMDTLVDRFPNIPIIRSIQVEVSQSINQMHAQLLQMLQEPVKLPSLTKAVDFLRKMGILDEEELAVAFLTSRRSHLDGLFQSIERKRSLDPGRFLSDWIDIWREGVHQVVTQFTSIFIERSHSKAPSSTAHLPSSQVASLRHMLTTFSHTLILELINTLQEMLPKVTDSSSLSSLLTKLSYCSTSFGKIGLEFRPLFVVIFENVVVENFRIAVEHACQSLQKEVQESKKGKKLAAVWMAPADEADLPIVLPPAPNSTSSAPSNIPASSLTSYPPLAVLMNGLLTALNSLRLLPPTSVLTQLVAIMDSSLSSLSDALLDYAKYSIRRTNARASFDGAEGAAENERNVLIGMARAWYYSVWFVRRGLIEGVYGQNVEDTGDGLVWLPWEEWAIELGENDLFQRSASRRQSIDGAEPVEQHAGNAESS
ncbi:hypothetical protein FRC03_007372 [Tulasnella sp. 419]|nr:hypothetical protein FRC03_007372 [Tulasnella sp. 419]